MDGQLARTGIPALALGPLFVPVWAVGVFIATALGIGLLVASSKCLRRRP
jgi:hypothetical protein